MSLLHVFGCRSPNSKGVGAFDGAFIYWKEAEKENCALFDGGIYVYKDKPELCYPYAVLKYQKLLLEGYQPMTVDDLSRVLGTEINSDTKLSIS